MWAGLTHIGCQPVQFLKMHRVTPIHILDMGQPSPHNSHPKWVNLFNPTQLIKNTSLPKLFQHGNFVPVTFITCNVFFFFKFKSTIISNISDSPCRPLARMPLNIKDLKTKVNRLATQIFFAFSLIHVQIETPLEGKIRGTMQRVAHVAKVKGESDSNN